MRKNPRLEFQLGFAFLLAIAISLTVTYFTFSATIDLIETERQDTYQFMVDWLVFENLTININIFYQPEGNVQLIPLDLAQRMGKFDQDLRRMLSSKVLRGLELTGQYPSASTGRLTELWEILFHSFRLRLEIEAGQAAPRSGESAEDSERMFLVTAEFKQLLLDRIAVMTTATSNQCKSLSLVAALAAFALLAVTALSANLGIRLIRSRDQAAHTQELLLATMQAQEAERVRIAMELHDSVAQDLVAISMAASKIHPSQSNVRDDLSRQLSAAITGLRQLSGQLYPADFSRMGLMRSLRHLTEAFRERSGLSLVFESPDPLACLDMPPDRGIHIFRIAQEALNNIERHARASHVRMSVTCGSRKLCLRVEDNGCGFVPAKAEPAEGHFGLRNMEERAMILGGSLRIESQPESGTAIIVEVPHA
jgi:signal transduction histidine kinase